MFSKETELAFIHEMNTSSFRFIFITKIALTERAAILYKCLQMSR